LSPTFPTYSPTLSPTLSPTGSPTEDAVAFIKAVNDAIPFKDFDKDKCSLITEQSLCISLSCQWNGDRSSGTCTRRPGRERDLQTTESGLRYIIPEGAVDRRLPVLANDESNREIFVDSIDASDFTGLGRCEVSSDNQSVLYIRNTFDSTTAARDTFCRYTACTIAKDKDEKSICSTATIRLTVEPFAGNDVIIARPDTFTLFTTFGNNGSENSNRINVLQNDFVSFGNKALDVGLSITSSPDIGTCNAENPSSEESYIFYSRPNNNNNDAVTCTYEACQDDAAGNPICDSAVLTITFKGTPANPIIPGKCSMCSHDVFFADLMR